MRCYIPPPPVSLSWVLEQVIGWFLVFGWGCFVYVLLGIL